MTGETNTPQSLEIFALRYGVWQNPSILKGAQYDDP